MTSEELKQAADEAQAKADELWQAFMAHETKNAAIYAEQDRLRHEWYEQTQRVRCFDLMLREMDEKQAVNS